MKKLSEEELKRLRELYINPLIVGVKEMGGGKEEKSKMLADWDNLFSHIQALEAENAELKEKCAKPSQVIIDRKVLDALKASDKSQRLKISKFEKLLQMKDEALKLYANEKNYYYYEDSQAITPREAIEALSLTPESIQEKVEAEKKLVEAAWEIRKAQNRMLIRWSESCDEVKNELWQQLHKYGDELFEALTHYKKGGE